MGLLGKFRGFAGFLTCLADFSCHREVTPSWNNRPRTHFSIRLWLGGLGQMKRHLGPRRLVQITRRGGRNGVSDQDFLDRVSFPDRRSPGGSRCKEGPDDVRTTHGFGRLSSLTLTMILPSN